MSNYLVFSALALYVLLLIVLTKFVKSNGDNNAFFRAGRKSPWLLTMGRPFKKEYCKKESKGI